MGWTWERIEMGAITPGYEYRLGDNLDEFPLVLRVLHRDDDCAMEDLVPRRPDLDGRPCRCDCPFRMVIYGRTDRSHIRCETLPSHWEYV